MSSAEIISIIGISIRGFKRAEVFDCQINQATGLITIGGENANGKSSVIEAVMCALESIPRNLTNPVNDAQDEEGKRKFEEGVIRVTLGTALGETKYRIIRKFTQRGPTITIFDENGDVPSNGQQVLKDLLGEGSIDPIGFLSMQPKQQRDLLAKLVGVDISTFDAQIEEAREKQKELERHQQTLEARASALPWYEDAPEEIQSADQIIAQINEINQHNQGRYSLEASVNVAKNDLANAQASLERNVSEQKRIELEIQMLQEKLANTKAQAGTLATEVGAKNDAFVKAVAELDAFQPKDSAHLSAKLSQIEDLNNQVRANQQKIEADAEWKAAEEEVGKQAGAIKEIEARKRKALSEAQFPVPDLAFNAQTILYKGQPFFQASMAERITVAVSIGFAMRGRVCPIFIRDASTLDKKYLSLITDMAVKNNAQVIAEIVANYDEEEGFDKDCTFYMVEGKKADVVRIVQKGDDGKEVVKNILAGSQAQALPESTGGEVPTVFETATSEQEAFAL